MNCGPLSATMEWGHPESTYTVPLHKLCDLGTANASVDLFNDSFHLVVWDTYLVWTGK